VRGVIFSLMMMLREGGVRLNSTVDGEIGSFVFRSQGLAHDRWE